MDLYSIQVAIESGWSTFLEPTGDVLTLHDTLTKLRHAGSPCRLVKCKVMKEYPAEKAERQDETVLFAADRMYDVIRTLVEVWNDDKNTVASVNSAASAATKAADDYDAAISAQTPDLAARVRRTL